MRTPSSWLKLPQIKATRDPPYKKVASRSEKFMIVTEGSDKQGSDILGF